MLKNETLYRRLLKAKIYFLAYIYQSQFRFLIPKDLINEAPTAHKLILSSIF
jgi:hypothetical protein